MFLVEDLRFYYQGLTRPLETMIYTYSQKHNMKRILLLLVFLMSLLCSFAQTFVPRTNGTFTPVDPYLSVPKALYIPRVCDTLIDPLHGGKDTVGAMVWDTCKHKLWVRDVSNGIKYWRDANNSLIYANGINRNLDTVGLGGELNKYTFIK